MELGIKVVHETPSRKGLRVVCLCRPECKSIAENQAWFKEQTGLDIDAATKDEARFSYLVPSEYFYYFDNEIWDLESPKTPLNAYDTENNLNHESHKSTRISQSSGQGSGNSEHSVNKTTEYTEYTENNLNHESHKSTRISQSSGQGSGNSEYSVNKTTEYTEYTENNLNHESHKSTRISQSSGQGSGNSEHSVVEKSSTSSSYLYRGTRLKDIAERYVSHFGGPVQGERHTFYYSVNGNKLASSSKIETARPIRRFYKLYLH